jgi:hypothetical protein
MYLYGIYVGGLNLREKYDGTTFLKEFYSYREYLIIIYCILVILSPVLVPVVLVVRPINIVREFLGLKKFTLGLETLNNRLDDIRE